MATNRKRRSYTAAQKEEALYLYQEQGPAAASRATRIPKGTIVSWARRQGLQSDAAAKTKAATEAAAVDAGKIRTQVTTKAIGAVDKMLDTITQRLPNEANDMPLKDLATVLGIVADKYRALAGMDRGNQNNNAVDMWLSHITGADS